MSKQKIYSKLNGISLIMIGLVFVVLSFYVDDSVTGSSVQSSNIKKDPRKPIDLINEHLQKSYDKAVIESINISHENKVLAPDLKDSPEENPLSEEEITALYGGGSYEDIIRKELNEKNAIQDKIVQSEIESKSAQEKEEAQRKYRQKYAKIFLESARKDGYEIELDEDYRIKSASKIQNAGKIGEPKLQPTK